LAKEQVLDNRIKKAFVDMEAEGFAAYVAMPGPFPGGGSVAAYAGSLAAALGEMMAGLTEGRAKFSGQDSRIREIHKELTTARNELKNLAEEDSAAFQSVLNARRQPENSQEEKAARAEAIERATKNATETPLRNSRAAFRILELLRILMDIGNPNAQTDVAIGAQLAYASLKSAQYNVLTNIPGINDKKFTESCRKETEALVQRAQEIMQQVDLIIQGS
jgi:formiminotetrahydrofolate cyclodeaminase